MACQPMRFFTGGLANGTYDVYANLYTNDTGRNMRYYWGYSPSDTRHYSVDTVGGSGGSTQHTEYLLGTVDGHRRNLLALRPGRRRAQRQLSRVRLGLDQTGAD